MFAGNCTTQVEFYDSEDNYNYKRAVTWSIVMAYLSHTHPAFETVFSIEAVNEPIQDASQTPGLGDCVFKLILLSSPLRAKHHHSLQRLCPRHPCYRGLDGHQLRRFPRFGRFN